MARRYTSRAEQTGSLIELPDWLSPKVAPSVQYDVRVRVGARTGVMASLRAYMKARTSPWKKTLFSKVREDLELDRADLGAAMAKLVKAKEVKSIGQSPRKLYFYVGGWNFEKRKFE